MSILDRVHGGYIHTRRVRVLCRHFTQLLPPGACVLDVGCGDGLLARRIMESRPDIRIQGVDVLVRAQTHIPVERFDGFTIPYQPESFDMVMFADVLHHTDDPMVLLREAARVARQGIILKDHTRDGLLADATLRYMDRVGNARYGVVLPYNYWPRKQWLAAFEALGLRVGVWRQNLGLYPLPADWLFGRSLHFIARLDKESREGTRVNR